MNDRAKKNKLKLWLCRIAPFSDNDVIYSSVTVHEGVLPRFIEDMAKRGYTVVVHGKTGEDGE